MFFHVFPSQTGKKNKKNKKCKKRKEKYTLSTSSQIWPSYTIKATILEIVFRPEKFPKTKYGIVGISQQTSAVMLVSPDKDFYSYHTAA